MKRRSIARATHRLHRLVESAARPRSIRRAALRLQTRRNVWARVKAEMERAKSEVDAILVSS